MKNNKREMLCLITGMVISIFMTGLTVQAKRQELQEELASQVLRFHVLANSDSEEDQNLKMKVKENVLTFMEECLPDSSSLEQTKCWVKAHLEEIKEIAEETIAAEGYEYSVCANVTSSQFPQKTYGDITFPSGTYEALRIEIGNGEGQNWWCVLYPNLCFYDAIHAVVPEEGKEDLEKVLDDETYEMVTSRTIFRIRWFFF